MLLMVSISGIRGVVGDSLTPEIVVKYASAFGTYCIRKHPANTTVVVGFDGRITGSCIADLVSSTLLARGVNVTRIGICPTPTVQLAVERSRAAGGVSVTASHNPIEWNGLKFMASTGMFLNEEENREVCELAGQQSGYAAWNGLGSEREDSSWLQKHIEAVLQLQYLDIEKIRKRKFRIVLDCVNAAGGLIVPQLLQHLGCEIVKLNCDVSGVFAHTPEPIPENLTDLARNVVSEKADFGIAVDPDVDRLVFVTEKGEPYSEEYTVATAVGFLLGRLRKETSVPRVVVNLSTTRAVDDLAQAHGAKVIRTPVGEINVAARMKNVGALIGGEGSGGVILPEVHLGRDAIVGIALVLQFLTDRGCTLSELKSSLPQYEIAKGKIGLDGISPDFVLDRLKANHAGDGKITEDDGLKIDLEDSWVHLRKSNTEPIVRIIAEARSSHQAEALVDSYRREILGLSNPGENQPSTS